MARLFTAVLIASLLGGCIVLPLGYDDHDGRYGYHHRYWGDRYDGGYRYWDDDSRSWRYRR